MITYEEVCARLFANADAGYRDFHKKLLKNDRLNVVISTGGGCPLRKENVQVLKENGKLIFLRASVDELIRRTAGDGTRPLLKGEREKRLKSLLAVRTPIYEKAADFTVDTDGLAPEEIANEITEFIK